MNAPVFADGLHCQHGYSSGDYCPACGDIPDLEDGPDEPCEFCGDGPCPHNCLDEGEEKL